MAVGRKNFWESPKKEERRLRAGGQIYKMISEIFARVGTIRKERKNQKQGYPFRGIEDMYNAIHPVLAKYGVFCCPEIADYQSQDRITYNDKGEQKTQIRVVVQFKYTFYGPDGSSVVLK